MFRDTFRRQFYVPTTPSRTNSDFRINTFFIGKRQLSSSPKSFKKKMKDKAFAAGVDRDEVRHGVELIGLDMDVHIANVIAAMQEISDELGLRRAPAPEQ